jgi:hypothetical protein
MFWPGGLLALELTTSTPDALCPPLEEARAAVKARVGDVRGTYHAEFALVRDDDGQQVLDLIVRDRERQVLHRELPLAGAGCQDAAQAIALVLERYFDGVEIPGPQATVAIQQPVPDRPDYQSVPFAPTHDVPARSEAQRRQSTWEARAGLLYDLELGAAPLLGAALFPLALRFSSSLRLGLALDFAPFLKRMSERVREEELSAFTLQSALSLPLRLSMGDWRTAIGPWAHMRLQRAQAPSLAHEEPSYRALWGAGGVAQLGWTPWPSWTLGMGVAIGAQLTGAAARFVLVDTAGGTNAVLVPDSWFGQGQLSVALQL